MARKPRTSPGGLAYHVMNRVEGGQGLFAGCASGPAIPHTGSRLCQAADFDADGDVDQSDFTVLQRCYSGPDVPADPACNP